MTPFNFRVELKGPWKKLPNKYKDLSEKIKKEAAKVTKWGASQALKSYRKAYKGSRAAVKGGQTAAISKNTRRWRQVGKTIGHAGSKTPWAVPTSSSTLPLYRTGALSRAIETIKFNDYVFYVRFNPTAMNPEGSKKLADIAKIVEEDHAAQYVVTQRMRAYFAVLFDGAAGNVPRDHKGNTRLKISIVFPGRPIFKNTTEALQGTLMPEMLNRLWKFINDFINK